jgi:hypothetical protein
MCLSLPPNWEGTIKMCTVTGQRHATTRLGILRGVAAAAAVALLASACGSGHHGLAAAAAPAPASASAPTSDSASALSDAAAPATSPSAAASVGTDPSPLAVMPQSGTDLMTFMVHPSVLGAGFAIEPSVDATFGDRTYPSLVADVTKADCTKLVHSSWVGQVANGQAEAQRMFKSHNTQQVTEDLDLYEDAATAESVMKNVSRLAGVCAGFTDPESGLKVTLKTRTLTGVGDQAYLITLTNPNWQQNANMLEAVRVGDVVACFFVLDATAKDGGAALAAKVAGDFATKLEKAAG